jgi:hypothetical protein
MVGTTSQANNCSFVSDRYKEISNQTIGMFDQIAIGIEVFCSAGMESCKRSVTSLVPQRCITGAKAKYQKTGPRNLIIFTEADDLV